MAITTGAVNVKFNMERVVNISELHVCDNLLEINAVYHFIRNVGKFPPDYRAYHPRRQSSS
jgi:hypothetical protein